MSRISFSDDEDYPGQFGLFQANCHRSLHGKAGQAALRELESALLAMPVKELHASVFVEESGAVCALGALAVHRKVQSGMSRVEALAVCADMDPDLSQEHGEELGFPKLAAWKVVWENDEAHSFDYETCEGPLPADRSWHYSGYSLRVNVSAEQRWHRVLAWVQKHLRKEWD